MRFLVLLFPLFLMCAGLEGVIDEVVELNLQNFHNKNQADYTQENIRISKQKLALMREVIALSTQREEIAPFSKDSEITVLQNEIEANEQIQNAYLVALNTISLNTLLAEKKLIAGIIKLQSKNHLFTTHTEIKSILQNHLEEIQNLEVIPLQALSAEQKQQLQQALQTFKITMSSYAEILSFLQFNIADLIPQSIWTKISLAWVLQNLATLFPQGLQEPIFSKLALSIGVILVSFFARKVLSSLIVRGIGYLAHLFKSKDIQDKLKEQIAMPILWLVLIFGVDVATAILFYPHSPFKKFDMWINCAYILTFGWLSILLFRGYGIALLGSLAQKNKDTFRREVINLLLKIIYFMIIVIVILVLLKNFGFNVSAIIASLGIGGLAVALAIKDMLANFFASVVLLFDNSFNQGDWIVCGNIEGTVVEMGLRRTTIRTFDNALLFVPNSLLANECVRNWNRRKVGRRIRMQIGLTYSSTPEQILQCVEDIKAMLNAHPKIAKATDEHTPLSHYEMDLKKNIVSLDDLLGYKNNLFVVVDEFAGSSINILVYCFSTTVVWGEWLAVRQEVMIEIMKILQKNNLSFAFPSQSIYVESLPDTIERGFGLKQSKI
ncbi:mechanosensitive ion channel family protein [Helicobacter enhydrae]|nr:mechanosensitive ion channel family protein [Helicobacter enhydrae]